jgi:putative heme-binding domain-containing protein
VGNAVRSAAVVKEGLNDKSPDVLLQVVIAAPKIKSVDSLPLLIAALEACGDDKLIPHIVWQNLHPLLANDGGRFLTLVARADLAKSPGLAKVLPRAVDRILGNPSGDPVAVVKFIEKLTADKSEAAARLCLAGLTVKVQNNELQPKHLRVLEPSLKPLLDNLLERKESDPLAFEAALLTATLGKMHAKGLGIISGAVLDPAGRPASERLRALDALLALRRDNLQFEVEQAIAVGDAKSPEFRGQVISKLSKLDEPWVATVVLGRYSLYTADEQVKAIELMTQRPSWAKVLFKEIAGKKIAKDVVNVNQARRLLATKDAGLIKLVAKHWGIPRDSRNPEREQVVARMKDLFRKTPGNAKAGVPIFNKVCGQCHKMYGEGAEVGPDLTSNGRADFDQLLSNIFDPSLVIGAGYQSVTVNTKQGQVLNGLIVEDNKERVVLKVQGGELKTIARADVEEQFTSRLSMMPEDLEKQLRPQEIVDLLEYLSLDRPPEDAKAKRIPGTPR